MLPKPKPPPKKQLRQNEKPTIVYSVLVEHAVHRRVAEGSMIAIHVLADGEAALLVLAGGGGIRRVTCRCRDLGIVGVGEDSGRKVVGGGIAEVARALAVGGHEGCVGGGRAALVVDGDPCAGGIEGGTRLEDGVEVWSGGDGCFGSFGCWEGEGRSEESGQGAETGDCRGRDHPVYE
jgi:hypothetical protein